MKGARLLPVPYGFIPRRLPVYRPQRQGEHEEGDLFDDHERVSDPAGPEFGPEFVYMVSQFTVDHFIL